MFEVSQTEGRDGSEAEGECNYKETWERLVEHYRIKCHYAFRPRDGSFYDANAMQVTPSYNPIPQSYNTPPPV